MLSPALSSLLALIGPARRRDVAGLLAMMVAGAVADLFTIGALLPFLAALVGSASSTRFGPLLRLLNVEQAAALFAGAALLAGLLRLVLTSRTQRFAADVASDCAVEIQRRLLLQPYSFHLQQHSSTLIGALTKVDELSWRLLLPLLQGVAALLVAGSIVGFLILAAPWLAIPTLLTLGFTYWLVAAAIRQPLERASQTLGQQYDARIQQVQESHGAIRDIILDGSAGVAVDAFRRRDRALADAVARTATLSSAPRFLVEALGLGLLAAMVIVVSRNPGGLTTALPLLGMLALSAQRLLPMLQQIYQSWASLKSSRSILADVHELLSLPLPPGDEASIPPLPFEHALTLKQVNFAYPHRERAALRGVDLTIARGERIALMGRSGSGKSTLADIIMGLLEPGSGALLVDGRTVDASNRAGWRRQIAHVPQTVFLSDGSIADNVAFGVATDERDPARLAMALRLAQLDGFVAELSLGAATTVGERGVRLSGGQRQRIGLARAIYRNTPLLVLDEATSALDDETEAAILEALDRLQEAGTTILIIAHRPTARRGCDRIVRLEDGVIVGVDEVVAL